MLFGPEIGEYIDELYTNGNRLRAISAARRPDQAIRPQDVQVDHEINVWFSEQPAAAREKFLKYLDFRQP